MPENILVIGMGRLGRTVVRSFGDLVTGLVTSRSGEARGIFPDASRALYDRIDQIPMEQYDLIWFAVPDRAIPEIAAQMIGRLVDWNNRVVLHSSGATSLAPLASFRERGAATAVLHPNAILSGDEIFPQGLVWGITLDGISTEWVESLLAPFAAKLIQVSDAARPLYHAAASVAANYSMVLFASAVKLYEEVGIEPQLAGEIVARFMQEGVRVASTEGLMEGLTGPVARGDLVTVKGHLKAVREHAPELLDLVVELVRTAARMVRAEERDEWEEMLKVEGSGE